jgi:hypothetical protein
MRIPNVTRAIHNLAAVRLRRAERHWRKAEQAAGRIGRHARRQQERLVRAPELARIRLQQGSAALERSRKRVERFDDHVLAPYRMERHIKHALAREASGSRPLIVGPWTSEVGYEALYWLPFLAWAADRYGVQPDRVIALSRGGTRPWYGGIANQYVEIFDLVEPAEFARQAASRRESGDQKQLALSGFDRELIRLARQRIGVPDAGVWHPGLMYRLFRAFWYGDRSLDFLLRHTDFRRLPSMAAPMSGLPAGYVAVKFYTGPALPDTRVNRAALHDLVKRVATRAPVVMLDTAWSLDEHRDYTFDTIPGVTTLRPSLDPATNLAVQTQVIAGARQFVGTCGGLAWLAPFLGVDTLAVYEDDRYLTAHLYAAKYAYRRTGAARFSTLNLTALRALEQFSLPEGALRPERFH